MHCHFFFFQAEDGIRDGHVTGVQMCALPISPTYICPSAPMLNSPVRKQITTEAAIISSGVSCATSAEIPTDDLRSEERRVGKECRARNAEERVIEKRHNSE